MTESSKLETRSNDRGSGRAAVPLRAVGLTKRYGQNVVLDSVTVTLSPGRVTALVGHNGAGKSTFLRCLSAAEQPDSGQILIGDEPRRFASPADAIAAGVGCVYQELSVAENLTVAQNVFLGAETVRGLFLSRREMDQATSRLCAEFGIRANPGERVANLPVAQRQLIEVAAAIRRDVRYLLLDEPTTALEPAQIDHLLATVRDLAKRRGLAVLFVNHKLDEVFAVADEIVCLSNGGVILDRPVANTVRADVVRAIVGDDLVTGGDPVRRETTQDASGPVAGGSASQEPGPTAAARDTTADSAAVPVRLEVRGLSAPGLREVSLQVAAGEVLGIYGLVGSGRSRFLRTLLGDEPRTGGTVLLDGREVDFASVRQALQVGFAYVTEERKVSGFIPGFDPLDNVVLPVLARYVRSGLINRRSARKDAHRELQRLGVRGSLTRPIVELSGGNQQKVLFARASMQTPRVLLLDEPTKGVDIGAKAELHRIVRMLAAEQDTAVIVVSSEEEELLGLADRICVFVAGHCDGKAYAPAGVRAGELRHLAWSSEAHNTIHPTGADSDRSATRRGEPSDG